MTSPFYSSFVGVLLQSCYAGPSPDGGWRFGPPPKDDNGKRMFAVPDDATHDIERYAFLEKQFPHFEYAFSMLEDEQSRRMLLLKLARFVFDGSRVSISMTYQQFNHYIEQVKPLLVRESVINSGLVGLDLNQYDLEPAGIPIQILTSVGGLINQFFLQQYQFDRDGVQVKIEPGDTVIEGGMCWGDSALNFAHKTGKKGRVIGFEFEPRNLQIISANFQNNPDLAKRIKIYKNALYGESGKTLTFAMAGPATGLVFKSVNTDESDLVPVTAETLTIDDMVEREKLDRVDYIKLDIEGAEQETMRGAEKTLRRFRPKLALSAYHRFDDIPNLIRYVHDLDLGYKFWLDHFKPDDKETMLFAKTEV